MDITSPEMREVVEAVSALHRGETSHGRALLLSLWSKLPPSGERLQACVIAHFLADTEAEVADELEWDLRALEAATGVREAEGGLATPIVPETFLASLYLNAGDAYRRGGDWMRAQQHALQALRWSGSLPDGGYGATVAAAAQRLWERLE
jgi:hypothetical protein